MTELLLGEKTLTIEAIEDVARRGRKVVLAPPARQRIERARAYVDRVVAGGPQAPNVYGVNTGFGALAEVRISPGEIRELQKNLVRSHAAGVGAPLAREVVRAMLLLRAQVLALGHSGVRVELVELLCSMLNRGVHPVIPRKGSVGASGDLAPLAHLALVAMGEGEAEHMGRVTSGGEAMAAAQLEPLTFEAKEGLALVNGTQLMTAEGALALADAELLCRSADLCGAFSLEALKGTPRAFDPRVVGVRPHPGQQVSARNLVALTRDSEIVLSHKDCGKVQDPYSLRCMPQVHGATRDALAYARGVIEREAMSATDNPLVFASDEEVISGGNFHGQPVALALDFAAIAVAELANISERRIEQLVNPHYSGLPPFLVKESGLNSGFMLAQVTAAALVSENKILAHPASVDSIPSSAGREDHVSMGVHAAHKLREIVGNVQTVLAIETLCAAQGIDLHRPLKGGPGVEAAHAALRAKVPHLDRDRPMHKDVEAALALVTSGELVAAAEQGLGAKIE
jgi:histidine ammonia-lyase